MTKGELKTKLSESLMRDIINIAKCPTLQDTKIDQLQGLLFLSIADDYWEGCDDNEEIS